MKKFTRDEFVENAIKIHGDKYDYSNIIDYTKGHRTYSFICKKEGHGEFKIYGSSHLAGDGCHLCNKEKCKEDKKNNFISKAKLIYGNKYDYSKVVYDKTSSEVEVVCIEHGEFFVKPTSHIHYNQGCPYCSNDTRFKKTELSEFIKKAKNIHGDKYDYSKVIYNGYDKNITVVCKLHGEFTTTPIKHTKNKSECQDCKENTNDKLNTKTFIIECEKIYGDKYIYKNTEYKNKISSVVINCKKHGNFNITPNSFLKGCGCLDCNREEVFINKSKNKYGDKYDYDNINYISQYEPVEFLCKTHDLKFSQKPSQHLECEGCSMCISEKKDLFFKTKEKDFIEKSIIRHANNYDYSKVVYKGKDIEVDIICEKHGMFKQTPHSHKNSGCPDCAKHTTTSFPEQALYYYISKIFKDSLSQHNVNNMEIDIFIPSLNLCIEYDGFRWHKDKIFFDTQKNINLNAIGIDVIRIRDVKLEPINNCKIFSRQKDSQKDLEETIFIMIDYICNKYGYINNININLKSDTRFIQENIKYNKFNKSIENTHPNLIKEWDYDLNGSLLPKHFTHGSKVPIMWKCSNNHNWLISIYSRTKGSKCPYCNKKK